ncbi:MAG: hypothetical protein HDS25_07645 [Bacteroides sp.]|nr:hypothetical protein [Bacteroides sp.]
MFDQVENNRSLDSDEEKVLREIQNQCKHFANALVSVVCNRAKRAINSWNSFACCEDDYPKKFTNYDILACEHQTKFWEEINPYLGDAILDVLRYCYEDLSQKDKFFIEYSACYYQNGAISSEDIEKILMSEFVDQLNRHWSKSKKIQDFELKRTW